MTRKRVASRPVPHEPVTDSSEHHQAECSCLVLQAALRQTDTKPESESRWPTHASKIDDRAVPRARFGVFCKGLKLGRKHEVTAKGILHSP